MRSALTDFVLGFWLCSVAFVIYAPLTFIITRRTHLWIRFLDAGQSFMMRLGFSKRIASFGRGFSESRSFAVSMVVFTFAFLLLAIFHAVAYLYFSHRTT
jgi:hypothetical protein